MSVIWRGGETPYGGQWRRLTAMPTSIVAGKLWEMRMTGKDGIARSLYMAATGRRVMVPRVFEKRTQKTPRAEIELAMRRAASLP